MNRCTMLQTYKDNSIVIQTNCRPAEEWLIFCNKDGELVRGVISHNPMGTNYDALFREEEKDNSRFFAQPPLMVHIGMLKTFLDSYKKQIQKYGYIAHHFYCGNIFR